MGRSSQGGEAGPTSPRLDFNSNNLVRMGWNRSKGKLVFSPTGVSGKLNVQKERVQHGSWDRRTRRPLGSIPGLQQISGIR